MNEGFQESPVILSTAVSSELVASPDDDVIRYMAEKFNVSREQILTTLREGAYDDVAAIYMLLLDQKRNGKFTGPTTPMTPIQAQGAGFFPPVRQPPQMAKITESNNMVYFPT